MHIRPAVYQPLNRGAVALLTVHFLSALHQAEERLLQLTFSRKHCDESQRTERMLVFLLANHPKRTFKYVPEDM